MDKLVDAWRRYHLETERFDRRICSGRDEQGVAKPGSSWEHSICIRHARRVWERVLGPWERKCGPEEWQDAKEYGFKLAMEELRAESTDGR